jgi:hypothetical protein
MFFENDGAERDDLPSQAPKRDELNNDVRSDEEGDSPSENDVDLRENLKNSYLKIIAELWELVDFDQTPTSLNELTKQIGSSLETKAKKNSIFKLEDQTIRKHLEMANKRFKKISPK